MSMGLVVESHNVAVIEGIQKITSENIYRDMVAPCDREHSLG